MSIEFNFMGFDPEVMALKVTEYLPRPPITLNLHYKSLRAQVREAIKILAGTDITPPRQFTSVVTHYVDKSFDLRLTPEEWSKTDIDIYLRQKNTVAPTQSKENQIMAINETKKLFEKRVYIRGVDASTLNDDQIFTIIEEAEHEAERMSQIQNKPQKLGKKIEKICRDIEKIKEYVDNR